jgi:hypothetical protein
VEVKQEGPSGKVALPCHPVDLTVSSACRWPLCTWPFPSASLRDNWRRWQITAYRVGRELRFRERDLERWLEMNRESAA